MERNPLNWAIPILNLVLRRFVLRLVWVALLATFGVNLCLTLLPAKRVAQSNSSFSQGPAELRKWTHQSYLDWITETAQGKMPISDQGTGDWETQEFISRVERTLTLCLVSFAFAALIGVIFGTYSASINFELLYEGSGKLGRWFFQSSRWTLFICSSLPAYVIAYLLFLFFQSNSDFSMAMFSLALGSGTGMDLARMAQHTHRRELDSKYVESAVGNGLKTGGLIPLPGHVSWHAFRNSLITLLPVAVMRLPLILSSAIIVEVVFDLPGMGESLLHGLINQDVPLILSILLVSVVFVQSCLFLAELFVFLLHPKGLTS